MKTKYNYFKSLIIPNKKLNFFVFSIICLGIVTGVMFFTTLSNTDYDMTIKQIQQFMVNINQDSIDNVQALSNSLITNCVLIILIWILGLSIIGIIINIFLIYIKSFMIGFSITSIIATYQLKGTLAAFFYIFPNQLFYLLALFILGVYSITFTSTLLSQIFLHKNVNINKTLKKYFIILIISFIITFTGSVCECFVFPALLNIVIKLFV